MPPIARLNEADLRLLRIFRTVVECGGFSLAEAELNISRPAISQHMADLEQRLGLILCQRGRAGFRLTEEGQAVYEALLRLLAAVENFRTEINAVHAHLRGELNIGITDNLVTSPRMRVTRALRALKTRGPDVRVNIRMIPPSQIERGVLDGQLHVGITPAGRTLPGLRELPLYDEVSHLYCAAEHPFFSRGDLNEASIAEADAVAPSGLAGMPRLRITATATDREGVAFLILTGCYIGFLPTHYARQWEERGLMRAIRPDLYVQAVEYQAVTLRSSHPNLVLSTFMRLLDEAG
ncbi:LysR family transcriptional regulator [Acidocella aromatica]|uniref:DNA-binding transcriptional LysR family regulator n=1 Tax=Acidocella aromatica TaxID=1303579 RepID=A0A840VFH2_9PROT|nr:LysR family transcriptional regulator [Acidocella aromatica]MBB5374446.1 DNA-binding transcriptional LysR family regulator [Acidocella aromatica]